MSPPRRVIVAGGRGGFGAAAMEHLRAAGVAPLAAGRREGADLYVDVEDPASLRATLRRADVVLDAAGPFQLRSAALMEAACDVGFDVIDLSDCIAHAERAAALRGRIELARIRVLPSCSTVCAVSAAIVATSGAAAPRRCTTLLAPALRHTARPGTLASLLVSLGRPIRVLRDGVLADARGWGEARSFALPPPFGALRGRLFETADSVRLPEAWPTLRTVDLWAHAGVPGLDALLALAARLRGAGASGAGRPAGGKLPGLLGALAGAARRLGPREGFLAYEVEDSAGAVRRFAVSGGGDRGFHTAVIPAVLATDAIAHGAFPHRGLVRADQQVPPAALFAALAALGIERRALPDA